MKRKNLSDLSAGSATGLPPEAAIIQKAKKRKKIKRFVMIAVIVLLIAAIFVLPKMLGSKNPGATAGYMEYTAQRRDISVSVSGTATIKPADSYNVTALVKGEILEAPFEEGQVLKKGDLLYKIEAKDVENSISQAKIALTNAKLSYSNALDNSSKLSVKAQSSGKIAKIYFDPGDSVQAGATIADIIDNQTMLLKLPFHSSDAKSISVGQTASVTLTQSGETLSGTVSAVSRMETANDGGTVTSEVTVSVKNPGGISEQTQATAVIGSAACSSAGSFCYNSSKSIRAEVSGDVAAINKKEGESVAPGDVIIKMTSTDISRQLESSALSVKNAELSLKNAEEMLENYEITAPISGTVIEKNFKAGDTIDATSGASTLAVIYDMSMLTFDMSIDELDIAKVSVGQTVEITADAVSDKTFYGYIDKVNINGVTSNGVTTYPVTVNITDSDGLLPGMNISAEISIDRAENVLAIPVSAVMRGNTVMLKQTADGKNGSGKASSEENIATLTLGRSDGDYIEVTDGLSEGDVILVSTATTSLMEQMMGGGGGGDSRGGPGGGGHGGGPQG